MWKSRDLSRRSDRSASRGVELDDEQQRRGRGALEDGGQVGEQVMVEVLPVSRRSLSLSSIDLVDEPGDKGIECQLLARRFSPPRVSPSHVPRDCRS